MSPLRLAATAGLSAVSTFVMLHAIGCRTKAVGINDCREIEEARCEAAIHCGDQIPVGDVEACKRFYRDQCLHGLATDHDPSSSAVRACVAAITSAGNCAKSNGADTRIEDCADAAELTHTERLETACDVIERPQYTAACFFLNDTDDEPPTPAGEGGAGGASFSGGAAGSEGAAGASAATAAGSSG